MRNQINIVLTLIIIILISSCHAASDKKDGRTPSAIAEIRDSVIDEVKTETHQKTDFDSNRFISLTDSLLGQIQGKSITLSYKSDTINNDKIAKSDIFNSLIQSDQTLIKRYSFSPRQGDSRLHFWFIEVTYPDTIIARKAFGELHQQTGPANNENDFCPGLTYVNDYVIRTEKKIYWLNTGCAFAFSNHRKISQFLLRSLPELNIYDSIWCQCGQPKCSL
jgi:hypothetical protein